MARAGSSGAARTASKPRERHLVFLSRLIFGLSAALLFAAIAAAVNIGITDDPDVSLLVNVVFPIGIVLINGIVALLIIAKYPNHVVGWLLLTLSITFSLNEISSAFTYAVINSLTQSSNILLDFSVWLANWIWFPAVIIPVFILPLYFPNGRLPSIRWRFVAAAAMIALLAGIASFAIHPGPQSVMDVPTMNPFGLAGAGPFAEFLFNYVALPLLLVTMAGALTSVIVRYRRSQGLERTQMKWVLYALVLGLAIIPVIAVLTEILPESMLSTLDEIGNGALWLFAMAMPAVIGVAILRHRLYDIDIIIRKTLVYGLLTGVLLLVYFGSVILLQQLFAGISGQRSPVAIVISTLAIAALFRPLRGRIQSFIDRRFYRRSYDASQTLADFAATARDEVDLNQLTAELVRVIQETMQPEQVGLWLAPMEGPQRETGERT